MVKILDFLVASNIYVSLGAFSLTWLSMQFYKTENTDLSLFVFFSTLFAYNFMRLVRVHPMLLEGESNRHKSIFKLRILLWVICILSGLTSFYFFTVIYQPILAYGAYGRRAAADSSRHLADCSDVGVSTR